MSTSHFASALDLFPEPVAILMNNAVQHRNRAWSEKFGGATDWRECFHAEDQERLGQAIEQACKERTNLTVKSAQGVGGVHRCLLWPLEDGAVALRAEEIAEPSKAASTWEEIVESPEKTLFWIFQNMDATVWATRKDGTIMVSHGPGLAHHGLKDGQLVGANIFQMFPPESNALESTTRPLAGETMHNTVTDGSVAWNQFCTPVRDAAGEVAGMVGLGTTLNADSAKMRTGQRLLDIVNELPVVVWAMKADGTCTLSAGKLLEHLGFQSGELVGKNLYQIYESVPHYMDMFRRVLAGESFVTEEPLGGKLFQSHYLPEKNLFGEVIGMYAVTQDVTVLRRAEEDARVHEEQLASQAKALAEAVSPIIEVWQGVLVVPLIGSLEQARAALLTGKLLDDVVRLGATYTILDLTGVDNVDAETANHLFQIMRSVELLGCSCLVSGIRGSVAQTMVTLDVPMKARTFSTLAGALRRCIRKSKE